VNVRVGVKVRLGVGERLGVSESVTVGVIVIVGSSAGLFVLITAGRSVAFKVASAVWVGVALCGRRSERNPGRIAVAFHPLSVPNRSNDPSAIANRIRIATHHHEFLSALAGTGSL